MIRRLLVAVGSLALLVAGLLLPAGGADAAPAAAPADTPPIDCTIPQFNSNGHGDLASLAASRLGDPSGLQPTYLLQDLGWRRSTHRRVR